MLNKLTKLVSVILAVTLAVIVGNRLSDEALAVLAGVMCGLGAAIPTSLLIVAASQQRSERDRRQAQPQEARSLVVVIGPPGAQWQPGSQGDVLPLSITSPPMVEREYNYAR